VRLGVFGGTFDPPHTGHVIVAQDACEALKLDRLLFVPAAQPPHKRHVETTPAATRLELVRAAVAGDPRFEVCDIELRRAGPSYMVDTLAELAATHPGDDLFLLLGADQFRELHTWKSPERVASLAHLVLLSRGGVEDAKPGLDVPFETLVVTRIDISATDVRQRAAQGRSVRYLVPAAVESLIESERLYRDHGPISRG
jgi:nicotinate-nucleotide adenylyltransferase